MGWSSFGGRFERWNERQTEPKPEQKLDTQTLSRSPSTKVSSVSKRTRVTSSPDSTDGFFLHASDIGMQLFG